MKTSKFTTTKARVAHKCVINEEIKQKNCAIVLLITLSFTLITSLQTSVAENIRTVQKDLPAVKTDQPPTLDGVLDEVCWQEAPQAIGFTAGLSSQIQWHFERRYQQIFTLTYDFSPALSLGSRLIWQVEGVNIYFALRRSGYAGTDFFHHPRRS